MVVEIVDGDEASRLQLRCKEIHQQAGVGILIDSVDSSLRVVAAEDRQRDRRVGLLTSLAKEYRHGISRRRLTPVSMHTQSYAPTAQSFQISPGPQARECHLLGVSKSIRGRCRSDADRDPLWPSVMSDAFQRNEPTLVRR